MQRAQQIAEMLLNCGAVKVSMNPPFTWTSGIKSPVYCDNRKMISYPTERAAIVEAFKALFEETFGGVGGAGAPEYVGGTATAAIPWAAFLAQVLGVPMVYIRPEKKEHGAGKQVEGDLKALGGGRAPRVLIVEDLISTGGSSVNAAEAVVREGGTVSHVFAIVTYDLEESKKRFEDAGLQLLTLTNFGAILEAATKAGAVSNDQLAVINNFKKDPKAWGSAL